MKYKIVAAKADIGQISVAYLDNTDGIVAIYAIDVPIIDGLFISGDALEAEIQGRAPFWLLERTAAVNTASNFDMLASLVDTEFVATIESPPSSIVPKIVELYTSTPTEYDSTTTSTVVVL